MIGNEITHVITEDIKPNSPV